MELSEIEAKADEYLAEVLATDSDAAASSWLYRLQGLKFAADIKQIVSKQSEAGPCWDPLPTHGIGVPTRCTLKSGHTGAHTDGGAVWKMDQPEPTKPAVDRLHELVSYALGRSDQETADAERRREDSGLTARRQFGDAAAEAYTDMATKLSEILREGEL